MSAHRFIEIDGKRYLWREILGLRREQKKAYAKAQQRGSLRAERRQPPGKPAQRGGPLLRADAVFRVIGARLEVRTAGPEGVVAPKSSRDLPLASTAHDYPRRIKP